MSALPTHCDTLLAAKTASGKSFEKLAQEVGKPEVWLAALFFGNAVTDPETAARIARAIGCDDEGAIQAMAGRGAGNVGVPGGITRGRGWEWPPRDPVLYRFAEAVMVYGEAWKAIIHEKCKFGGEGDLMAVGDGIMSAITFRSDLKRVPDPNGDRVVITLDGKVGLYVGGLTPVPQVLGHRRLVVGEVAAYVAFPPI
jgi:cyanate lyase